MLAPSRSALCRLNQPLPATVCYRITGVPPTWTKAKLLEAFNTVDPGLGDRERNGELQLSLLDACVGRTKTALLNTSPTAFLKEIQPSVSEFLRVIEEDKQVFWLEIDRHFYGLTPTCNPEEPILVDIIAVTGLAGHAWGSWKSRQTQQMWLKDFLPKDISNARIMTYGYDCRLVGDEVSDARLLDYKRDFIQQLENARATDKMRPIIFIGHSLGCILVLQTLSESFHNLAYRPILEATAGIFFFGAPHQGLRTEDLDAMLADSISDQQESRRKLLSQIKVGSEFLETQRECMVSVWDKYRPRIVSFYEMRSTPSVIATDDKKWARQGPKAQLVSHFSGQLYLPFEKRIPVDETHSDIVKFSSATSSTYQTVVQIITDITDPSGKYRMAKWIARLQNPANFLAELYEPAPAMVDCLRVVPPLPTLDPAHFWIFKNIDFESWKLSEKPCLLWITGPARRIAFVATSIARQDAERQRIVLYFNCDSLSDELRENAPGCCTSCIHSLLGQFIRKLPLERQTQAINVFLGSIQNAFPSEDFAGSNPHFAGGPKIDLQLLLREPPNNVLAAFTEVLRSEGQQELLVVVDNMPQKLVKDSFMFHKFSELLVQSTTHPPIGFKVLLTSSWTRAVTDILSIRGRWPRDSVYLVEYDMERKECLGWLRFTNTRYSKILRLDEDSLAWFWNHDKYRSWSTTRESALLYIEGKPGSGKSTLTRHFYSKFLKNIGTQSSSGASVPMAISFFYSHREGKLETSHFNMLRSVLYSILEKKESLFFHYQREYREHLLPVNVDYETRYNALKRILLSLHAHPTPERIYLIIDAVDESDDDDRAGILKVLFELCRRCATKSTMTVKIFIASRPITDLEHCIEGTSASEYCRRIRLQDSNKESILRFVDSFLGPEIGLAGDIKEKARQYIVGHAQGVFVWVECVRKQLLVYSQKGYTEKQIFRFLASLPVDLQVFYECMLKSITECEEEDMKDGGRMIQITLHALRPLTLRELQHALAVSGDDESEGILTYGSLKQNLTYRLDRRIMHCTGNFLEIKWAEGVETVQVMHQTVREFFFRQKECNQAPGGFAFGRTTQRVHQELTTSCVRYLMLLTEGEKTSLESSKLVDYVTCLNELPFMRYCLDYLGRHIELCDGVGNTAVEPLRDWLLQAQSSSHAGFCLLREWAETTLKLEFEGLGDIKRAVDVGLRQHLLSIATARRLPRAVELLLSAMAETEKEYYQMTPLAAAVNNGDAEIAHILARGGALVSNVVSGPTLHRFSSEGHVAMVSFLLQYGANINELDTSGIAPLQYAIRYSRKKVIDLLLEKGADPDEGAQTSPVVECSYSHKHEYLEILLSKGADPNKRGPDSTTALHIAASANCVGCVELLLRYNADIECLQSRRMTPLLLAVSKLHTGIVRMLIARGADLEAIDCNRATPLHVAVALDSRAVATLLSKSGANIEARRDNGDTPLLWAARRGLYGMVSVLLAHGADIEARSFDGDTSMHYALKSNRQDLISLLADKGAQTTGCRRSRSVPPPSQTAVVTPSTTAWSLHSEGSSGKYGTKMVNP